MSGYCGRLVPVFGKWCVVDVGKVEVVEDESVDEILECTRGLFRMFNDF